MKRFIGSSALGTGRTWVFGALLCLGSGHVCLAGVPIGTTRIEILPSNPTTNDNISLRFSGTWSDGCTPQSPQVTGVTGSLNVQTSGPAPGTRCTQALTPWSLTVGVGQLGAGRWHLAVRHEASTLGETDFIVATSTEPIFNLSVDPSSRTVTRGTETTYTVTVSRLFGFSAPVDISTTSDLSAYRGGLAPGIQTGTTLVRATIIPDPQTSPGRYTVTFIGRGGGITRMATVELLVNANSTATLAVNPTSVERGSPVTVTWASSLSTVTLATYRVGDPDTAPSWRSVRPGTGSLDLFMSLTMPLGAYEIRMFESNSYNRVATSNTFTVTARASTFNLTATPSSRTVQPGQTAVYRIQVERLAGFSDPVSFEIGYPSGSWGASYGPNPQTGTTDVELNLLTYPDTPIGSHTISITGRAGGISRSTAVTINVTSGVPDIELSTTALRYPLLRAGESADRDVMVRNGGTADLVVSSLILRRGTHFAFSIDTGLSSGLILRPGESRSIRVRFQVPFPPPFADPADALLIASNDPDEWSVAVGLFGDVADTDLPELQTVVSVNKGCSPLSPLGNVYGPDERIAYSYCVESDAVVSIYAVWQGVGTVWHPLVTQQSVRGGVTYTMYTNIQSLPIPPGRQDRTGHWIAVLHATAGDRRGADECNFEVR